MNHHDTTDPGPFIMVIFGATGDLARYKLIPALFHLFRKKQLPGNFYLFGFARRDLTMDEFHKLYSHLSEKKGWDEFAKHFLYQQGKFEDEAGYRALIDQLQKIDDDTGACVTRIFYLATPPEYYETILAKLNSTRLSEGCGFPFAKASPGTGLYLASQDKQESNKWTKIVIEKPFGKDLRHARELDRKLAEIFEEKQIFRVDHYLGKEVVQNIIAFRFANGIFDPVWKAEHLDHVQITISERNGLKGRGQFFEGVGNLRDVAQNHLLQLVTAIAMEQPRSFTKEGVRDARAAAMKAIRPIHPDSVGDFVVRGQYDTYKKEDDVSEDSQTETFVAMKMAIDTPRFAGIPLYVRAGKKMAEDFVEISLVFTQTCHILFKEYGCPEIGNVLTFRIQPDEGIHLRTIAKHPGTKLALSPVNLQFTYKDAFGGTGVDAYEKLLQDIFSGDQILFNRSDELEYSWQWITGIMEGWSQTNPPLFSYPDNSWGPKEADDLLKKDGRSWLMI
jgi:glucose-6-phosphate 1-dehydrogenase